MTRSTVIFVEIEVAMIAIDETTIWEILRATIALHSDLKFDKVSGAIKEKKSWQNCAARSGSTFWSRTRKWRYLAKQFLIRRKWWFRWKTDDLTESSRPKPHPQVPTYTEAQYKREGKSMVCRENFPEFFNTLESNQAFNLQHRKMFSISFINNHWSFQKYY